jgi:hypothetical protein
MPSSSDKKADDRPSSWAVVLVFLSLGFAVLAFTLLGAQLMRP